jgi:hypothetical protein
VTVFVVEVEVAADVVVLIKVEVRTTGIAYFENNFFN